MTADAAAPARLALQTGRLDDRRPAIAPGHRLWRTACELFADQERSDGQPAVDHDPRMAGLCVKWPASEDDTEPVEALAVALALAAPFADEDRILRAIAPLGSDPTELSRLLADAPVVTGPYDTLRPPFPRLYDPDSADRSPIVAMLDGPRSSKVAELMHAMQDRDPNLADAMVLGADLEILDLLEELGIAARRAGRSELADMFEHDRRHWQTRADAARARQRLEGIRYHWHCDNLPPECMEAAQAEAYHNVDVLLHPPPTTG